MFTTNVDQILMYYRCFISETERETQRERQRERDRERKRDGVLTWTVTTA